MSRETSGYYLLLEAELCIRALSRDPDLKGDGSPWARGYRRAISNALDEIKKLQAKDNEAAP